MGGGAILEVKTIVDCLEKGLSLGPTLLDSSDGTLGDEATAGMESSSSSSQSFDGSQENLKYWYLDWKKKETSG